MTIFVPLFTALALLTQFADPFVGTDAHGHTFPGACAPFGMVQLSPDTRSKDYDWDRCSGYHASDSLIYGFSHTHLSGTGCADWCDILVTPGEGPSRFSHKREKASPGFYKVWLDDARVTVRLTAGKRVGMHEYRFRGRPAKITVDLNHRDRVDSFAFNCGPNWISGCRVSTSWAKKQHVYFYIEFSEPFEAEFTGEGRLAVCSFKGRRITLRAAISSVSEENARANLLSEYPESFNALRKRTEREWNDYLAKVECPFKDQEHKRRFYTAMYHTGIHPSLYSDADGSYRGMDGQVHRTDGWDRYTVFSLWDTFRAEHPLLFDIEPERSVDFIKSMISIYEENGKLPVWELSGYETDCMIGYNSAPVIAEAVARGLGGFDVEKAFEALVASSLRPEHGMDSFRRNGMVLADDSHESVSKTLEYAYDDWCVAQVAKYLGREEEYRSYMTSSQYWRNVFDPTTGFMRARLNGRWFSPFDPREVNNNYTEANSWQYSFFVPHDVPGLIEALGGPEAFESRLDSLFKAPEGNTGRRQADITGCIGQYAHGNEPSHHIPYLYDFIGKPEKSKAAAERIMETLYSSERDGLCGNDDCGQMSAWYVLSAVGRYPVCPGADISGRQDIEAPENVGERRLSGQPASEAAPVDVIVTNPAFEMEGDIFLKSMDVAISGEGTIWYRIDGGPARKYTAPFKVTKTCTMEAWSERDGRCSFVTRSTVHSVKPDRDVTVQSHCSEQYTAGGPQALIDGRRGGLNWRTGGWQGYQDTDFDATVDLRTPRQLSRICASFCQDAMSWIWMPQEVVYSVSENGTDYTEVARIATPVGTEDTVVQLWECSAKVKCKARYVKVHATNIGTIPEWHPGAGSPGFIFVDEIAID